MASPANALAESGKLVRMGARQSPANNHLVEAMALLIRNQAAFVEQISRSDQERLGLQIKTEEWQSRSEEWRRRTEEWQRRTEEWQRKTEEWQRKSEERFARIEAQLTQLPAKIVQAVLDQLPRIKKEIGFKSPT
jgi:hypothetical protein